MSGTKSGEGAAVKVLGAFHEAGFDRLSPEGQSYVRERLRVGAILDDGHYNFGAMRNLRFGATLGDAWRHDVVSWMRANPGKLLPLGYHMSPQQRVVADERGTFAIRVGGMHVTTSDMPVYNRAGRFEFARSGMLGAGSMIVPVRRWYGFTLVNARTEDSPWTFSWIRNGSLGVDEVFFTDVELVPERAVSFLDPWWREEDRHDVYWAAYHREPDWFIRNMDERRQAEFRAHGGSLERDRGLWEGDRSRFAHVDLRDGRRDGVEFHREGEERRDGAEFHREGEERREGADRREGGDRGGGPRSAARGAQGGEVPTRPGSQVSHPAGPGSRPSASSVPSPSSPTHAPGGGGGGGGASPSPSSPTHAPGGGGGGGGASPSPTRAPGGGGGASPSPSSSTHAPGGGGGSHGLHGAEVGAFAGQHGRLAAVTAIYSDPGSPVAQATLRRGIRPFPAGTPLEVLGSRRGMGARPWLKVTLPGSPVGVTGQVVG